MTATTASDLERGCADIVEIDEFRTRLAKAAKARRPLRVIAGFSPTSPSLHLGHALLLGRLHAFQDAGHDVTLVMRDFSARLVEPHEHSVAHQTVLAANAANYREQAFKLLDPSRTTIATHGQWLTKLGTDGLKKLAAQVVTLQAPEGAALYPHYRDTAAIDFNAASVPLLHGFDAMVLQSEVEIGGGDQSDRMLLSRDVQRLYAQPPQSILMLPMLPGTDGLSKMSTRHNNAIYLDASAEEMVRSIMSLSDNVMWRYGDLFSMRTADEMQQLKWSVGAGANLQAIKLDIALEIAARFHSAGAVRAARDALMAHSLATSPSLLLDIHVATAPEGMLLSRMLMETGLVASSAEGNRMIDERVVRVNQQCVEDRGLILTPGPSYLLEVGALRRARVTLRPIMSRSAE